MHLETMLWFKYWSDEYQRGESMTYSKFCSGKKIDDKEEASSKKNTLIFWKSKSTTAHNHGWILPLETKEDADKIIFISNQQKFATFSTVNLTDEQLQSITDEETKQIKNNISLNQFSPFLADLRDEAEYEMVYAPGGPY